MSERDLSRDEAIAAGLLAGGCEWCGGDVWKDREEGFVEGDGYVWHRACAEENRAVLEAAL